MIGAAPIALALAAAAQLQPGAFDVEIVQGPIIAPANIVAMGGAVTNLTAVSHSMAKYDPDTIQGTVLERAEIDRQIELYRTTPLDKRAAIVGLQPKRADVILAGACIVRTVMDMLGKNELTVSDRGLRHGLLVERFGYPGMVSAEQAAM